MNCVIYANCQGQAIGNYLRRHDFGKEFDITNIINHRFIGEKTELPRELLEKADLFIYQPIDKKRDVYCTLPEYPDGIANILKKDCIKIAFPYIYNDGVNILYDKGLDVVHKEIIIRLKNLGLSLEETLERFKKGGIDFNLVQRFNDSMDILEDKERDCDITVSGLIKERFRDTKIFFTQNHVANIVLFKIINEILGKNGFLAESFDNEPTLLNQLSRPVTPYEIEAFRFTYQTAPDEGWYEYYKAYIERIYAGNFKSCNEIYSANLLQVEK